jgi:type IV pilus assembly protein PilW
MRSFVSTRTATTRGFTLIEILIAMAIGAVVMAAIVDTFITQRKSYDLQEQISEMIQSARISMDMMSRDVRMAGYNPTGASFDAIPYEATKLEVRADRNGDGDPDDPGETIAYFYDAATRQIIREASGSQQPLADNITDFTFQYLNQAGSAAGNAAEVYQIQVSLTARTADFDPRYPNNGGYRTYTLTSFITPRNIEYNEL